MKYQPVLPEHNDNVSHQQPLKEFFILLFGLIGIFLVVFWVLGFFVDMAVSSLSPEIEIEVFSGVDFLQGEESTASDRQVKLQQLVNQLTTCAGIQHPIQVDILASEDINAVAYPGGKIAVYAGLLDQVHSENGLAFVLGHELGHIKNRDHLRALGRGLVLVALSVAFTGSHSDISQFLAPSMHLGHAQYSQNRESSADEIGLHVLQCYYGHVGGATEFFEALQRSEHPIRLGLLHYFSSHPELQQRIARLHALSKSLNYTLGETKVDSDDL